MTRDFWPIGGFFFNGGSHALGRVGGGGGGRLGLGLGLHRYVPVWYGF